jgi:hypothetical protein
VRGVLVVGTVAHPAMIASTKSRSTAIKQGIVFILRLLSFSILASLFDFNSIVINLTADVY